MNKFVFAFLMTIVVTGCADSSNENDGPGSEVISAPTPISYNLVQVYPHDTSSYTQGLIWYNNTLYEGTGLDGESKLLQVDLQTGKHLKKQELDPQYFGEGITILDGKIYQLTYTEHKVFVYDLATFKKTSEFEWPHQGWGLTNNGSQLIISTGGSDLYFVNPETFEIDRKLAVFDHNGYVSDLNELEYVNGYIFANRYGFDYLLKIDPKTGKVAGKIELSDILQKGGAPYDPRSLDAGYVLNGIAYDSTKNSFYVTGKRWPALYEIKLN